MNLVKPFDTIARNLGLPVAKRPGKDAWAVGFIAEVSLTTVTDCTNDGVKACIP